MQMKNFEMHNEVSHDRFERDAYDHILDLLDELCDLHLRRSKPDLRQIAGVLLSLPPTHPLPCRFCMKKTVSCCCFALKNGLVGKGALR